MGEMVDTKDRISELPCVIIHQIMSYLSAKEVAQTSILSKRWNHLRISLPLLDFDEAHFLGKDLNSIDVEMERQDKGFRDRLEKFVKFVDISLIQFCGFNLHMQKFRLNMILLDVKGSSSLVDNWIQLALENKVEELDLCFPSHGDRLYDVPPEITYTVPPAIFSANWVTSLKLGGCRLELPSYAISFHSLKKLTLERIYVTKDILPKLAAECPLLKDLFFFNCGGFTRLSVEGSKYPSLENLYVTGRFWPTRVVISSEQLKKLQLVNCTLTRVVVHTPNLLFFSYSTEHRAPLFRHFSIHAPCPWKVSFEDEGIYACTCLRFTKDFLGASKRIEDLSIHYNWKMLRTGYFKNFRHQLDYDYVRRSSPFHPCEVENLSLYVDASPLDYEALLNNFLLICYPKTLSVKTCSDSENDFGEWLYTQLRDKRARCCSSSNIKCWRHYLKSVNIENDYPRPCNVNNLIDGRRTVSQGLRQFRLDWCLHGVIEKKRKLPKTGKKNKLPKNQKKNKCSRIN